MSRRLGVIVRLDRRRRESPVRAAILTGLARLEWAKVVRRSVDLYWLGINSEKQFNTGDNERGCKSVQQAESIEREVNALANLLAAGMEGSE